MADLLSGANRTVAAHAKYGVILFAIYVVLYFGFIGLSAFRADLMAEKPFGGINLAVMYGLALIVAAFVLAMVYMFLCRPRTGDDASSGDAL